MSGILITGSGGRLGSSLYDYFKKQAEVEVVGITRKELELSKHRKVNSFVKRLQPSIIYHAAAMTGVDACEKYPEQAHKDNVLASRNIAAAAADVRARLVYFSTDYVFDGHKDSPYNESDIPFPINIYGQTKLEGEKTVASLLSNYVTIRVAWLFGKAYDFISFVKESLKLSKPLKLAADHLGSPGYIPDLLPAIDEIAQSEYTGIFHLSNSGGCSRFQMGSEIIAHLNLDIKLLKVSGDNVGFIARRPGQSILESRRYRELTGKVLRSWQEALIDYLENSG